MTGCTEKAFEVLDNKQYLCEPKLRLVVHVADKDWISPEGQF